MIARQPFSHKFNWNQNNDNILKLFRRNSQNTPGEFYSKRVIMLCVWIKGISRNPGSGHKNSTQVSSVLTGRNLQKKARIRYIHHTFKYICAGCKDLHSLIASKDWKNTEKCVSARWKITTEWPSCFFPRWKKTGMLVEFYRK